MEYGIDHMLVRGKLKLPIVRKMISDETEIPKHIGVSK